MEDKDKISFELLEIWINCLSIPNGTIPFKLQWQLIQKLKDLDSIINRKVKLHVRIKDFSVIKQDIWGLFWYNRLFCRFPKQSAEMKDTRTVNIRQSFYVFKDKHILNLLLFKLLNFTWSPLEELHMIWATSLKSGFDSAKFKIAD